MAEEEKEKLVEKTEEKEEQKEEKEEKGKGKEKKKKKKKEEEKTQWWEYVMIIAVLSYKCYTPLPETIEDRYSRSVGMFLNKAVYKVGHFIRIVSPSTEISYLEAAWGGISAINNRPVDGVIDSMVDLSDYNMHFFTPEKKNDKPRKAIYYVHGGIAQGLSLSSRYLREMAKETGAIVVAPDYRRPPIAAFPTPFDDCLAGAKYLVKHADDYNIDVNEIVLVGNSFGAQIAASIAFTNGNLFKKMSLQNPPAQNTLLNLPSYQMNKYFMLSDTLAAWYWSGLVNGENGYKYRDYLKNSNYLYVKKHYKSQFKLLDPFAYFKEEEVVVADGKPWRAPEGDYMAQEIPEWMADNVEKLVDYRVSPLFASTDLLENAPETFIYASELDIFSNDAVMLNKRLVDVGVKSQLEMVKMSMHNEHFLSKYFWGFNTYMPSADKHVEAYFTHLKNIL